eukprot:jgi/Ulvmu1/8852/UM049_0034.1
MMTGVAIDAAADWRRRQRQMADKVSHEDECVWELLGDDQATGSCAGTLRHVAGLDISTDDGKVEKADQNAPEQAVACIVVCELPTMEVVYEDFEVMDHSVPYVSGFLGFREVPAYTTLIDRLNERVHAPHPPNVPAGPAATSTAGAEPHSGVAAAARPQWPQVFLVDGYGVLHHRRCGSASHLGVERGIPTIGVAKTLLQLEGLHERSVRSALVAALGAAAPATQESVSAEERVELGDAQHDACSACIAVRSARSETVQSLALVSQQSGETLGVALAGMHGSQRPIYVSTGHKVSLGAAVAIVLACCVTRIPEPIRQADLRSRAYVRDLVGAG